VAAFGVAKVYGAKPLHGSWAIGKRGLNRKVCSVDPDVPVGVVFSGTESDTHGTFVQQMLDNHWMADRIEQAVAAHDDPQAKITTYPQGVPTPGADEATPAQRDEFPTRPITCCLAVMSALATLLRRWQPIAVHSAILADARPEAVAGTLGDTAEAAYDLWPERALRLRGFVQAGYDGRWVQRGRAAFHRGGLRSNVRPIVYRLVRKWMSSANQWS
jgi:hypothetical protein